ncbi:MAG: hypothetical protein JO101_00070 [Candidatus Eremiobacteraeota bacterium]|nr:hypothetical protein [Candidatus Eremiobacteraeota bacterium]MBV8353688.1 hypothetical protein [Candidatus Eremiobacteraeota bacterium]
MVAEKALEQRGKSAVHLVDPTLVDGSAAVFPIDESRYAAMRARARELSAAAERLLISCSVYNGIAPRLAEEIGVRVDRSDFAAANALCATSGETVGVIVSFRPTLPITVDYLTERFAAAEQQRVLHTSIAADVSPFDTDPDAYRKSLLQALEPLRDADVLFLSQYTMHAHVDALRQVWGDRPLVSALEATVDAL